MSLTHWKMPKREKNYSIVHIGRFDNLPFLYFGPKKLVIKKVHTFLGKTMESGWLYSESKKIVVRHPAHFWPFLKTQAQILMQNPQISFKSFYYNVNSELNFFSFKIIGMVAWKKYFQTGWAFLELWIKLIVKQRANFWLFFQSLRRKTCATLSNQF